MKKTKITALMLSLVMLYSAAVPGTWATDEEQVIVLGDEIIGGDGVVVEEIPEDTSISEDEPADSVVVEDEPETDAPETETPDAEEDASGEETEIEKCEYCDVALTPDAVHDEWCMTNFETEESGEDPFAAWAASDTTNAVTFIDFLKN